MKQTEPVDDFRVWCEGCRIRIAPIEERTMNRGKAYHTRCYAREVTLRSKSKAAVKAMSNKF